MMSLVKIKYYCGFTISTIIKTTVLTFIIQITTAILIDSKCEISGSKVQVTKPKHSHVQT